MPSLARQSDNAYARVVDEVLSAVFAPAQRAEILREALETADVLEVPAQPTALRVFLEGGLFTTLARHLAVEDAIELVRQVRSALEIALDRGERPRSDVRARPIFPPDAVVVATHASLVVFLMQDVLGQHVEVHGAQDPEGLRRALRRKAGRPLLVVVDRRHPCVELDVVESLAELTEGSVVVWWSAAPTEQERVRALLPDHVRLLGRDTDARLGDLGELCASLVGGVE